MKIMIKKFIGIALLGFNVLVSISCNGKSASTKYNFNACNGFDVMSDSLYYIKNHAIISLNLEDGEQEDYLGEISIPKDINEKNIVRVRGQELYVKKDNKIIMYTQDDEEWETLVLEEDFVPFEIPDDKYTSIYVLGPAGLVILDGKTISSYIFWESKWKQLRTSNLEREYNSFFPFEFTAEEEVFGFIDGKKIDLISLKGDWNTPKVIKHLELDKQYDAYVGYYDSNYETYYLGCIDGNKIRFYDVKRGQFAKIPFTGEEFSWTL